LRASYRREAGEVTELSRLPQREAWLTLIRHSYAIRVFRRMMTGPAAAEHLRQCTALARRVPVSRLTREHRLEAVSEIARRVEADVDDGARCGVRGALSTQTAGATPGVL